MKRTPLKRNKPLNSKEKAVKKAKKKKVGQRTLKARADVLAAAWCKKDGICLACHCGVEGGSDGRLEWAHLKSRGEACIRHEPSNAVPLCHAHHFRFTKHPDEWYEFIERVFPGRWAHLRDMVRNHKETNTKTDYQFWIDWYRKNDETPFFIYFANEIKEAA